MPVAEIDPVNAYLDNASTTRIHPDVRRLVSDSIDLANPSSLHTPGRRARRALEDARARVAASLSVAPSRVVFTSGATEANNLAVLGLARAAKERGRRIVTTAIEHSAVLGPCAALEREGYRVTTVGCDSRGRVSPRAVVEALNSETVLVSVMLANNEVGSRQPVEKIATAARSRGILVHCDAAQACGKLPLAPCAAVVDAMTLSAHKMHGPRGVGVLVIPAGSRPEPLLFGGDQEQRMRPGTENVAAAMGCALALELAESELDTNSARMELLRGKLLDGLRDALPGISWNAEGEAEDRLPSILSLAIPGLAADAVVLNLDAAGVAVSSGSACHAASIEPSHVLRAMGLDDEVARGTIRMSVASDTTDAEIEHALRVIPDVIRRLRRLADG